MSEIEPTLDALVERAQGGSQDALEAVVRRIQDRVYNLALRMLWHPEDARDATQEILVRIVTHLGSFRGESAFSTWVYRVAANHLLTTRKRRAEREEITFEQFGAQLDEGLTDPPATPDQELLAEEVKVGCTHGMLLCLDRDHRLAYVLGDIFGVTSAEGGEILAITPAAFRKRLSRARARIRSFMQQKCGLVNENAACRCARRIEAAVDRGRVDPDRLLFAGRPALADRDATTQHYVREVEALHRTAAVFRSNPHYAASDDLVDGLKRLFETDAYRILRDAH